MYLNITHESSGITAYWNSSFGLAPPPTFQLKLGSLMTSMTPMIEEELRIECFHLFFNYPVDLV
jgi:hypothetical protein